MAQHIGFKLGVEEYSVPILSVREIINVPEMTHMPSTPDYIEGVANLRGSVVPIVSTRKVVKTGGEAGAPGEADRVIVLINGKAAYGILVDGITGVIGIDESTIDPPEKIMNGTGDQFVGVAKCNGRLIVVLDPKKLLPGWDAMAFRGERGRGQGDRGRRQGRGGPEDANDRRRRRGEGTPGRQGVPVQKDRPQGPQQQGHRGPHGVHGGGDGEGLRGRGRRGGAAREVARGRPVQRGRQGHAAAARLAEELQGGHRPEDLLARQERGPQRRRPAPVLRAEDGRGGQQDDGDRREAPAAAGRPGGAHPEAPGARGLRQVHEGFQEPAGGRPDRDHHDPVVPGPHRQTIQKVIQLVADIEKELVGMVTAFGLKMEMCAKESDVIQEKVNQAGVDDLLKEFGF